MEKKTIKFDDGSEVTVVNENGRYYICEDGTQYAKSNRHIIEVGEHKSLLVQNVVIDNADADAKEEDSKTKKKTAKKKTAKKEEE